MAGHFTLQLLPKEWPLPGALKWRKLGTDGILECQVENGDWLKCHLAALQVSAEKPSHEHLLTEHSEKLAAFKWKLMYLLVWLIAWLKLVLQVAIRLLSHCP